MFYFIRGWIDPRKTGEGRRRAQAGEFDPPPGVEHILEYEEPDGSYFELVETGVPENVRLYMKKSSHLFVSYEFYEAALLELRSVPVMRAAQVWELCRPKV